MTETARERAEQSVSARFTRLMNATTSRWGMFTDPSIIGFCTAPAALSLLAAIRLDASPGLVTGLEALTAAPVAVAVALALSLLGARAGVIDWLASVPFPVENMNAVLNGLGETLEITFRDKGPATPELNAALDGVSAECFVTRRSDEGEPAVIEVRIGIVDSTRNPSRSNHQRFERVRALVHDVLIPLADRYPVVEVRVK